MNKKKDSQIVENVFLLYLVCHNTIQKSWISLNCKNSKQETGIY